MNMTSTAMGYQRNLPAPHAPNGDAVAACNRPSCHAMKKHAVGLAQQVEALTVERDALRTALDERIGGVDWTPLGGERVMRALTPTEARICEALLLAGRERRPDDAPDAPPSGEFRTARYAGILRHAWGPGWGIGDDGADRHLIRVNAARLRHRLRAFDWDVVAVFDVGMRLVPWTGEPIPLPPERPGLGGTRVTDAERAQIAELWKDGYRLGYIETVTGRSADSIRRVLRAGRLAVAMQRDEAAS
jgi:hypothetical protein